jgi:hypothetical protein
MKLSTCSMFSLAAAAIACASANAAGLPQRENPYRRIALRNVFGLRAQPAAQPVAPPTPPLPKMTLTGITTIFGMKRAFLEITPLAKPGVPAVPKSCMLKEGDHEGEVQIKEIDPKSEVVKVSCSGTMVTLTFDKNGRKSVASTGSAARPFTMQPFPGGIAARRRQPN